MIDPAMIRERLRKLNADPQFAAANAKRASERLRKLHDDPQARARNSAAVSVAQKARWARWRAEKARRSGEN